MARANRLPYFGGVSSSYSPTSSYGTFERIPGTGRNTVLEVIMSPSTGTEPIDFRLVQGMPRLTAGTSDIDFRFASTTYTNKTSSFTISTTKGCYMFALQTRQSTNSTTFSTTVQARWIAIS